MTLNIFRKVVRCVWTWRVNRQSLTLISSWRWWSPAREGFNGKNVYAFLLQFYVIFLDNIHYLSFNRTIKVKSRSIPESRKISSARRFLFLLRKIHFWHWKLIFLVKVLGSLRSRWILLNFPSSPSQQSICSHEEILQNLTTFKFQKLQNMIDTDWLNPAKLFFVICVIINEFN